MEEARWLFAGQAVGTYSMLPCPDRVPPRVTSTDMRGDWVQYYASCIFHLHFFLFELK